MKFIASELWPVVAKLAEENPGAEAKCVYFNDDATPCCIVGHGMAALGADPREFLSNSDLNEASGINTLLSDEVLIDDDDSSTRLLRWTQTAQDGGRSWGDSLAYAQRNEDEYVRTYL